MILLCVVLLAGGCASLPEGYERTETHALEDTASTALGLAGQDALRAHAGQSGCRALPGGVDALAVRMLLAEVAERSLDVQYYIWRDDLTGRLFANALLRAADRGVRVRVLIDDVGTRSNDETLLALDAHPNIEIRVFNPVASRSFRVLGMLGDFARINRRMHNKVFVADNQRAVLGGRNIADEYFNASSDLAFGDLDVLTLGPVVAEASRAFDAYWNAPASLPITALMGRQAAASKLDTLRATLAAYVEAQQDTAYVRHARSTGAQIVAAGTGDVFWGRAQVFVDDPDKITRAPEDDKGHLLPQLHRIGVQLRSELLIVSPYFVPGEAGVASLTGLVGQGVRVTVLTNSLAASDVGAVHAGYKRYREALVDGGVRLYELKPDAIAHVDAKAGDRPIGSSRASLHAKTFVLDQRAVFIGSLNLDPRSVQLNTEIGVICESEAMARDMAGQLTRGIDKVAWRVERSTGAGGSARLVWTESTATGTMQYRDEPGVSAWRQLGIWFLGLLPIESQL
ncbi:phospholipase D family protein [Variovorax rhizosphaerae]|uniref:Phospholipase D family protein n=1 Tax=Variovorax rhizosphaerae TaxID=1836200 RepID=A0ABU8WU05_9BURK